MVSNFPPLEFRSVVQLYPTLWPHRLQHARLPCPSLTPRDYSNSCPLSWWYHPTIPSSVIPSPPAFYFSQHQGLFKWVNSLDQVAKVLEFQLQHLSFQRIFRTNVHLLMFLTTNSMICVISGFFLMFYFFFSCFFVSIPDNFFFFLNQMSDIVNFTFLGAKFGEMVRFVNVIFCILKPQLSY